MLSLSENTEEILVHNPVYEMENVSSGGKVDEVREHSGQFSSFSW